MMVQHGSNERSASTNVDTGLVPNCHYLNLWQSSMSPINNQPEQVEMLPLFEPMMMSSVFYLCFICAARPHWVHMIENNVLCRFIVKHENKITEIPVPYIRKYRIVSIIYKRIYTYLHIYLCGLYNIAKPCDTTLELELTRNLNSYEKHVRNCFHMIHYKPFRKCLHFTHVCHLSPNNRDFVQYGISVFTRPQTLCSKGS